MLQEMMNARIAELNAAGRIIGHRMELEQLSRIERLERALRSARSRLGILGQSTPARA